FDAINIEAHAKEAEALSAIVRIRDASLQLRPHFAASHPYLWRLTSTHRVEPYHQPHGHRGLAHLNLSDHAVQLDRRADVLRRRHNIRVVQVPAELGLQDVPPVRGTGEYGADF